MATTYKQIMDEARRLVPEVSVEDVRGRVGRGDGTTVLDVREKDEYRDGHLDGAISLPRGFLEIRVEETIRDKETPIIAYCAGGTRSLIAARTLREMGYTNVVSMSGGFTAWKNAAMPFVQDYQFTTEQLSRYSRHFMLPEVGEGGQAKLLAAKVLLLGAGGLGSPTALYFAAAGVGTLGIIDHDVVDLSNLQRQILHTNDRIGMPKVESARIAIEALNPDVRVVAHQERLSSDNVLQIFGDYDIVIDGCDNFPTRYLVNDACVMFGKPNVHGSIFQFEGMASVFDPRSGPCYRCLYPEPPPPGAAPSCAEAGVLGVLPRSSWLRPGTRSHQAHSGYRRPLIGRMVHFDTLSMEIRINRLPRDPECPMCGEHPTITKLIDYEEFCGLRKFPEASPGTHAAA